MADLVSMMNLGQEMKRKLSSVGIGSCEELMAVGSKEAFRRLKKLYPNVCLVHLFCLEGAICQTEYTCLSKETKLELKEFSDSLKG